MAEFHKKESEELEKEHDKLYELLEEDKKKVSLNNLIIETADLLLTVVHRYLGLGWGSVPELSTVVWV